MTQETSSKANEPPKEVKQKYMELQMMQMQAQQVQQQVQALEAQAAEMENVTKAIEEFSQSKVGSDMFVTLTPGLFVKAKLEESDKVLLNVGGGTVVQKTIPEAKQIIVEQGAELRKLEKELTEQLQKLTKRTEEVQGELRKLIK